MKIPTNLRDASRMIERLESRGVDIDGILGRIGLMRSSRNGIGVLPLLGSFTAGLAVGAGLGMIFAPMSGAETRQSIRTKAEELLARMTSDESDDKGEKKKSSNSDEKQESKSRPSANDSAKSTASRTHA